MNFSKNLKAFLKTFPLKDLSGQQMFLIIAAHCAKGRVSHEITISDIRSHWPKVLTKKSYNPVFYNRAQQQGWVDPVRPGICLVNESGIQHLTDITIFEQNSILSTSSQLYIFDKKSTHTFDKFLRSIFANTKLRVMVADSWVDETIFDNVLDSIPKNLEIKLIYGQKRGSFDSRVVRFKKEYKKFNDKKYSDLHDRCIIIDDIGYILGPSIKDAASNSPALVAKLNSKDSAILIKFFNALWMKAK
ncbi:MAG: hypothetical protein PHD51_02160 [Patescibacteria group bacterium]|nr:hypothetical protein [Patescibacteria group bacterium]MDD5490335.1 hypothetical protein [Patescibacteria group bacterium]